MSHKNIDFVPSIVITSPEQLARIMDAAAAGEAESERVWAEEYATSPGPDLVITEED
jgi:hypothetical protein